MRDDFYRQLIQEAQMAYALHQIVVDADNKPIDYRFIEVNQAFEDMTGLLGVDIIEKTVLEVIPEIKNDPFDWIGAYGRVALMDERKEFVQFSSNLNRWYKVQVFSSDYGYFTTLFYDITNEKQQSLELESFFEINLDLLSIVNFEGRFVKINKEWETILGYTRDELYAQPFIDLVHPEDKASTLAQLSFLKRGEEVLNFINRYRCSNGAYRYLEWRARPYEGLIYAAARDMTAHIESSTEILEQKEKFELAIKGSNDGIFDWNIVTNKLYLSPKWKIQLGYEDYELENHYDTFAMLLHPDDKQRVEETIQQFFDNQIDIYDVVFRMIHKDGSYRWIRARADALRDETGIPYRMAGSHTDITELKANEAALIQSMNEAEAENLMKSQFLANMSHEIRTPMSGIMGYLDLLSTTHLTREQRDYVSEAKVASDLLLYLINDILDFSKVEAGKVELEYRPFKLRTVVEDTISSFLPKAISKSVELLCVIEPDVPEEVVGDASRLRQILNNIIGNALKFTDKGEVFIQVRRLSGDAEAAQLIFDISDTGIGMSQDVISRLFKPFVQADNSTTRLYGGTGLGLAITSELVKLMGGSVTVTSEPQVGSTFSIKVEMAVHKNDRRDTATSDLSGLNVLVVEGQANNRSIIRTYLSAAGCRIEEADNFEKAVSFLLNQPKDKAQIDLVLIDYQLPDVNGYQLSATLKAMAMTQHLKLILLVSAALRSDAGDAKSFGFSGFVTKPIRRDELFNTIQGVIKGQSDEVTEDVYTPKISDASRLHPRAPKILLVEDNEMNQKIVTKILKTKNMTCDIAADGLEALQLMSRKDYSIVFMDCQMPVMDGFECTARIRETEGDTKHTIIVAMTANAMDGDKERCLDAGMDDYLSKPIDFDRFFGFIETYMPKEAPQMYAYDLVLEKIHRFIQSNGLDPEDEKELTAVYLKQLPEKFKDIEDALAKGNLPQVSRVAHQIKGSLGSLDMGLVCEIAEALEIAAKGGNQESSQRYWQDFIQYFR